jgi:hypothetical protein
MVFATRSIQSTGTEEAYKETNRIFCAAALRGQADATELFRHRHAKKNPNPHFYFILVWIFFRVSLRLTVDWGTEGEQTSN